MGNIATVIEKMGLKPRPSRTALYWVVYWHLFFRTIFVKA